MHISLTPRLEAFVKSRVESGLYNNASEVIREALRREMDQEPDYDPEYVAWVNGELEKGLADLREGRYRVWDKDDFMARLDQRMKARQTSDEAA